MSRLEVTGAGLREGVFLAEHLLPPEEPLLPDVRAAAIDNLLAGCDANVAHAHHVAALSLQLHDSLVRAKAIRPLPGERDLLWAAAMAHDVGMAVAYDGHAAHPHYLVLNAGLPGFTPRETALIGQMARYHRKGNPTLGQFSSLGEDGDEEMLTRCSAVLRVAEQLERSRDQAVDRVRVKLDNGRVELTLDTHEDVRVARWAAQNEAEVFKKAFGRDLAISEGRRAAG